MTRYPSRSCFQVIDVSIAGLLGAESEGWTMEGSDEAGVGVVAAFSGGSSFLSR